DHPARAPGLPGRGEPSARGAPRRDGRDRDAPREGRSGRPVGLATGRERRARGRTDGGALALPPAGGTSHAVAAGLMAESAQVKIRVPGSQPMVALLGQRDELLKPVESAFASRILARGNEITITGEDAEAETGAFLFEELLSILGLGQTLTAENVGKTIDMVKDENGRPSQVFGDVVLTTRGRTLAPKTLGQKRYVDAIRRSTVTFAIGPAGTGKTYLAVATAVKALQDRTVPRIILTRPAVEAGERPGCLPGTL